MESSNTLEPVGSTGAEAASAAESTAEVQVPAPSEEMGTNDNKENLVAKPADIKPEPSLREKIGNMRDEALKAEKAAAEKAAKDAPATPAPGATETPNAQKPAYEPNWKYKAFGKEKELDEFWRPLIKDADSEKKVKDVFTRADAFDDMKGRFENLSTQHQQTMQTYTSLDRDVRRVTTFLNNGDYDNFFAALKITDQQIFEHLQRKAELAKLSPIQQQQYQAGVQARAEALIAQESYATQQQSYAQLNSQLRTMQLDMTLTRPEVSQVASSWDAKMGPGAFRKLVIDEAASVMRATNQDLPADAAVEYVMKKFGKLLEQPAPQAPGAQTQATAPVSAAAPQAQATTTVQGKPVIPNVQGRGTSPVKQAPKSLDDLRKMAKQMRDADSGQYVANI